ncbi:GHKL domain-containing protein [Pedobacter sp. HMF7647]|uniref:histidine kinase n=1 Tax=Hufsiella arboris TaxID=2695275 RepID=A0A7K1Y681_9SPHI|nr:GHKL domain-containing protein [Hufsiella arboris]
MNTPFKIRLLIFILSLCFVATAVTINLTSRKEEVLNYDARILESNLHNKENIVKEFLANPVNISMLKNLHKDGKLAAYFINDFIEQNGIYVFTYHKQSLLFWGTNMVVPETDAGLSEGSRMIEWQNGWYESIKQTSGDFSVVFYIPVKAQYAVENRYLKNQFSTDLLRSNNLDIAGLNDKDDYNIRNADGKYLFSVKLRHATNNSIYSLVEFWMWLLAAVFGCVFFTSFCSRIVAQGFPKTAVVVLFSILLTLRLFSLQYNWLGSHFDLPIFDPRLYADNFFFPSIGDLLLNVIATTWFLVFVYYNRFKIRLSDFQLSKWVSIVIFVLLGLVISLVAMQLNNVFFGMITNSKINFDLSNILNLNAYSWLGILILCITVLNLYLIVEIIIVLSTTLNLSNKLRSTLFIGGLLVVTICKLIIADYSFYYLLFSLIIFIRGFHIYKTDASFNLGIFVFTVLVLAVIASLKLSEFNLIREHEERKVIVQRLESSDDPNAIVLFSNLEKSILKDELIAEYFKSPERDYSTFNNRLQRSYFDGYLSRFDFKTFEYEYNGKRFENETSSLNHYRDLVVHGAIKVTDYFYRINNTFGYQNYFALLPIVENGKTLGTLIIDLKSKPFADVNNFPGVLEDSKMNSRDNFSNYSFAFYHSNRLIAQSGRYVYSLSNLDFSGKLKSFIFKNRNGYNHLIYQTNDSRLIIVSKPRVTWVMQLASISFLFLVLLVFSFMLVMIGWIVNAVDNYDLSSNGLSLKAFMRQNRILYKTRIQASMVAAVVLTLLLVGAVTYISTSVQYQEQQKENVVGQINKVIAAFQKQMFSNGELIINEQTFNIFAESNSTDLNYYDSSGKLVYTTQPKLFDYGLISNRINPLVYINMHEFERSEFIGSEHIGGMKYLAAYKPITNRNNETIAYIGLPYFSNVHDYEARIGQFLNTLINVYALVFVAIGFFAVFIANRITYPLTMIEKSFREMKIGHKNEKLEWKRNDEIGSLIKEYNNMLTALDDSAQKLARSEREIAWKEMAKQVAHEIKNPLTPLKLGVQLLERSYREKDPNFNKKFEKFSKSFIEQIESLSLIASEFSNFAKMPETTLGDVNLREVIDKSIEVYKNSEHLVINLNDELGGTFIQGDPEQLLRCFNNLIKNAIEAIPADRPGLIQINMQKKDRRAAVSISDNGRGIPDGLKDRIFNPNFTTKSSGTGLGLAFVKQAIENMQGTISFKTSHDEGTEFYITLPLVG